MSEDAMSREQIIEMVRSILADVLDNSSLVISENSKAEDIPEWDSINHVKLLLGIETEMGFRFKTEEIGGLDNVGQLVELIEERLRA
jgi:acyl carrier protein